MKTPQIVKIKCAGCHAAYNIPEDKIPPGATSVKCKKCGHRIPIPQKSSDPVVSKNKRSEEVHAEKRETEKIQLVCAKCNRKYRFPPGKIPEGVTSVKCKVCGHQMTIGQPIPETPSTRRETCKKCGYQRTIQDDRLYSRENCPKCGLLYSKGKLYEARKGMSESPEAQPSADISDADIPESGAPNPFFSIRKTALTVLALLLAAAGAYLIFFRSNTNFENTIGMEFVYIPPGTFVMGGPPDEAGRQTEETPHQVTITKGFYMQVTETTQEQWRRLLGYYVSDSGEPCPNCPVTNITFRHIQNFIHRLNRREGVNTYRLPTEAEWEYACRSGVNAAFSFGDNPEMIGEYAWYAGNSDSKAHPVGQKKPNSAGLYDMHGNVAEMCLDWYGPYPAENVTDPKGPVEGGAHVLRGGSWFDSPENMRSASRSSMKTGYKSIRVGFRLIGYPAE